MGAKKKVFQELITVYDEIQAKETRVLMTGKVRRIEESKYNESKRGVKPYWSGKNHHCMRKISVYFAVEVLEFREGVGMGVVETEKNSRILNFESGYAKRSGKGFKGFQVVLSVWNTQNIPAEQQTQRQTQKQMRQNNNFLHEIKSWKRV